MRPLDIEALLRALPGRRLEYFDRLDSTMHEAARLAAGGCPSGTAVIAEEQTAGQGRHGHEWHSEPGSGLYVSVVLRPRLSIEAMPVLTLALGMAVGEAVSRTSELRCDIRWPNDLMLGGKKTAGILVQFFEPAVVAGIGINVNHAAFPRELAGEATSLRLASGHVHSREELLAALLPAVDSLSRMLEQAGPSKVIDLFSRSSSYARGKRVAVDGLEGVTAGLTDAGFLIVRADDGREHVVLAGGVRSVTAQRS